MTSFKKAIRDGCLVILCWLLIGDSATGSGKLGIYAIRMVPYGLDAETYTRPSWGGGIHAVFPLPIASETFAATGGLEFVNFLNKRIDLRDRITGLRVEQTTSQNYVRLFAGAQLGGHGNGFLRPHAGVNLALIFHDFSIDNVVPNDADPDNPISQNLEHILHVVFGYDLTIGLDLNFSNTVALDGGVKYVKSFFVPQQLGSASVKIYPQYFQIYFGVGVSFDVFK
ncbi:MAG: hypothetical protein ACKVRP_12695 [Bacteroidota bacterium]